MQKLTRLSSLGLLFACSIANANSIDTYGISARSNALGGAMAADDDGAYAAYHNPATLATTDKTAVAIGFLVTDLHLKDLSAASGPDTSGLSPHLFRQRSQQPHW